MNPKIIYYSNGNKKYEAYRNDLGQPHNECGPATIEYYENGNKRYEFYIINDRLHNTKGPAYIVYFKNGKIKLTKYYFDNECINVNSDEELLKYIKRLNIS